MVIDSLAALSAPNPTTLASPTKTSTRRCPCLALLDEVLISERCRVQPRQHLCRVARFLGLKACGRVSVINIFCSLVLSFFLFCGRCFERGDYLKFDREDVLLKGLLFYGCGSKRKPMGTMVLGLVLPFTIFYHFFCQSVFYVWGYRTVLTHSHVACPLRACCHEEMPCIADEVFEEDHVWELGQVVRKTEEGPRLNECHCWLGVEKWEANCFGSLKSSKQAGDPSLQSDKRVEHHGLTSSQGNSH